MLSRAPHGTVYEVMAYILHGIRTESGEQAQIMQYYNDTVCLIFSPFFIKLGCY